MWGARGCSRVILNLAGTAHEGFGRGLSPLRLPFRHPGSEANLDTNRGFWPPRIRR